MIIPFIFLAISIPSADLPEAVGPIINFIMQKFEVIYSKEQIQQVLNHILEIANSSSIIFPIVFLHGEIGTGKTFLVSHLLKQLGVNETITSPTFSIFNEYQTDIGLIFHYDLYRIKKPEDLIFVDLEDNLETGIVIIEWPEMARQYGVIPTMEISLSYCENSEKRIARIEVFQQKKFS